MQQSTTDDRQSEEQAKRQLEAIREMIATLNAAESDNDREAAEQTIYEDPLSIRVRTGWYCACDPKSDRRPEEFEILLCTGGPACRIIGRLDEHQEPESARIEHQDWGTPWTEYFEARDDEALLAYCRCFCIGGVRVPYWIDRPRGQTSRLFLLANSFPRFELCRCV